jgi:hypothetical protein
MRCQACNAELNDREQRKKDQETGEFLDLCAPCLSASEWAVLDAQFTIELEAEVRANVELPTVQDPMAVFEAEVSNHWESWGDGIPLMSRTDRRIHLYGQAKDRFLASVANGDKLNVSMDTAFQVMPKRNGLNYEDGQGHTTGAVGELLNGR